MAITTDVYRKKLRDDRAQTRIIAGKKAICVMVETILTTDPFIKVFDYEDGAGGFSQSLIDSTDAFVTGFIKNTGATDIDIQCDLSPGVTGVANRTTVKPGEKFDIGQFNGSLYSVAVRRITTTATFEAVLY